VLGAAVAKIVVVRVSVEVEEMQSQTVTFNDEDVTRLEELGRRFPGAYVSGELVVDAPELVKVAAVGADRLETIALSGNAVRVRYGVICELVGVLREQYVTGSLVMKIRNDTLLTQ
jgi:hypothetical protein